MAIDWSQWDGVSEGMTLLTLAYFVSLLNLATCVGLSSPLGLYQWCQAFPEAGFIMSFSSPCPSHPGTRPASGLKVLVALSSESLSSFFS
jgi:hypothetical protein